MAGSVFLAGFRCFGTAAAAAAVSPSHLTAVGTDGGSDAPSLGDGAAPSCCGRGSLTTSRVGRLGVAVCVLHVTDGSGWLAARGACACSRAVICLPTHDASGRRNTAAQADNRICGNPGWPPVRTSGSDAALSHP